MIRALPILLGTCALALIAGCSSQRVAAASDPLSRVVKPATPAQKAASFDQLTRLAGDWRLTDDAGAIIEGEHAATTRFEVTSAGTVVREIMFAGHSHEMTNIYHMDGKDLIVTHYCAVGNQPRMRATSAAPGRIAFNLDSITNFTSPKRHAWGRW